MTEAELASIVDQLHGLGARTVSIGTARDASSRAAAARVTRAFRAADGVVQATVDWPEQAASWLRQARRLTADHPDAWVICARTAGWLSMGRRLAEGTDWAAQRTVCWAELEDTALLDVPGLVGLRGARTDGGRWRVARGLLVRDGSAPEGQRGR